MIVYVTKGSISFLFSRSTEKFSISDGVDAILPTKDKPAYIVSLSWPTIFFGSSNYSMIDEGAPIAYGIEANTTIVAREADNLFFFAFAILGFGFGFSRQTGY